MARSSGLIRWIIMAACGIRILNGMIAGRIIWERLRIRGWRVELARRTSGGSGSFRNGISSDCDCGGTGGGGDCGVDPSAGCLAGEDAGSGRGDGQGDYRDAKDCDVSLAV